MVASNRPLLALLSALVLPAVVTSQGGQSIIPSSEPACANQCPIFIQALAACQPDSAVQSQYQSCFCQSAYLAPIKGSSANICAPQCSESDWTTIENWYNSFCANGGTAPATTSPATTLATSVSAPPAAAASSTTSTYPSSTPISEPDGSNDDTTWTNAPAWFHAHWQWVVMLIVLFVAFLLIGILGTIFYKRYKRRREYGDSTAPGGTHAAASHPEISQWAPSQHSVHDFGAGPSTRQSPGGMSGPISPAGSTVADGFRGGNGKGKETVTVSRAGSRVRSPPPPLPEIGPSRVPSRRLTKTPVRDGR